VFTDRTVVSRVLCLLSLATLASCFGGPIKIKGSDAAVPGQHSDGSGVGGETGFGDGPGPVADSKTTTDGLSSNGGAGGNSGTGDGGGGGSAASSGAGSDGSSGGGPDAAPDAPPDVPAADAPGTCSADKDCPSQSPLCLGNQCAKCSGDSDCSGRAGPACATSGSCVACISNKHCTGGAKTCDTATNQCVGCVTRSDCWGACQICTNGVCTAVQGKDDPVFCDGTCDSTGACKRKQGQACLKTADCAGGIPCVDGYCCDRACAGACQACDVANSFGTCTTLSNGTAPHTGHPPCDGSGTCMGTCNGLSASCTYPGAETMCIQAGCTGQTATLATRCAGDGTCPHADTKPCNGYGCSTTQPVCLTSCPVSGQILCNGSCVDVQSSASHCGTNCTACGGATPKCVSGSCVQCATNADCNKAGSTCSSNKCIVPGWTCDIGAYQDGVCNCGCGVPDPDCGSTPSLDACKVNNNTGSCAVARENAHPTGFDLVYWLSPSDPSKCVTIPATWTCYPNFYGDPQGFCDCGCGAKDSDCPTLNSTDCFSSGDPGSCAPPINNPVHNPNFYSDTDLINRWNNAICITRDISSGWTCPPNYYADGQVCDCGCGLQDPDCLSPC
jgi:hypothetical protein